MINLLVIFDVKPQHIESFTAVLAEDKKGALQEPGNLIMRIYSHKDKPNIIYAYESWEDQAAIEYHNEQSYTKNVIQVAETALQSPVESKFLDEVVPEQCSEIDASLRGDELIVIFFIIKINEEMLASVLNEFPRQVELTRKEAGNYVFNLYKVSETEDTFVVYEYWKDKAALNNHFQEEYSLEMGGLLTEAVEGELSSYMNFVTEIV